VEFAEELTERIELQVKPDRVGRTHPGAARSFRLEKETTVAALTRVTPLAGIDRNGGRHGPEYAAQSAIAFRTN
jgi:hypothetical protein